MKQTLIILLLLTTFASAQSISISSSDWQAVRTVDATAKNYSTPLGTAVNIFIGEPSSEAQSWDFSQIDYILASDAIFITPSSGPQFSYLPNSNLVVKESSIFGDQTFVSYTYQKIENDQFIVYGNGSDFNAPDVIFNPFVKAIALPLTYGTTWTSAFDTEIAGIDTSSSTNTYTADAYGTIKLPHGEFPAVRVFCESTTGETSTGTISFYTKGIEQVSLIFPGGQVPTESSGQAGVVYSKGSDATSVTNNNSIINGFQLCQNYPNPFNPSTTIQFTIPKASFVELKIYNALGSEVAVLVNEERSSGTYELNFDAGNLPSGIYMARLSTDNYIQTQKMVLLK